MNLRLLLLLLLPISLFSCKKGGDDAHDAEMRKLNAWILVNNITVTPTASGLYFIPVIICLLKHLMDILWDQQLILLLIIGA